MAIALFGGSFDPPHTGHVEIVDEALKELNITKLIILPTFVNPFKTDSFAPSSLRFRWLQTLFKNHAKVEVSDFESAKDRSTYTIESVQHFKKLHNEIYFIIGADNLKQLDKWHRFDELTSLVTWVVATRDALHVDQSFITLHVKQPISSTNLRQNYNETFIPTCIKDEIHTYYKKAKHDR